MGVRYYLATSAQATTAARGHPDLTELATSGPWVVFQVADSELVEPLENEPAVLDGVDDAQHDWICRTKDDNGKCAGPAVAWYTGPRTRRDVHAGVVRARRRGSASTPTTRSPRRARSPDVEVSDIEVGTDRSPSTSTRSGAPVLVKASYFPNWRVEGADGPYRVAPNLMVVVPTRARRAHLRARAGRVDRRTPSPRSGIGAGRRPGRRARRVPAAGRDAGRTPPSRADDGVGAPASRRLRPDAAPSGTAMPRDRAAAAPGPRGAGADAGRRRAARRSCARALGWILVAGRPRRDRGRLGAVLRAPPA